MAISELTYRWSFGPTRQYGLNDTLENQKRKQDGYDRDAAMAYRLAERAIVLVIWIMLSRRLNSPVTAKLETLDDCRSCSRCYRRSMNMGLRNVGYPEKGKQEQSR